MCELFSVSTHSSSLRRQTSPLFQLAELFPRLGATRRTSEPAARCGPSGIGSKELAAIVAGGGNAFPERLFWQPIFYPVLTREYADLIARDWNSTDPDHDFLGYVTRFQVRNEYLSRHEIQTAAGDTLLEYWIPADELGAFNAAIVGGIAVVAEFRRGELVASPD